VYLIRKDALDATPPGHEVGCTVWRIAPEINHYYATYDDSDGIRILFEHTESAELAMTQCRDDLDAFGRPCDPARVAALQARRPEVANDAAAFARLLAEEDLYLDVAPLVYWSHWITPSAEPKRFDTRFFAIAVPGGQGASADFGELTHHEWVQPARAQEAIESGLIRVVPPTLLTLEDLAESHARHGGLAAMLAAERGRPAPPIMPRMEAGPGEVRVLMPWDEGYATAAGEGCESVDGYPEHLLRRPSRVVMSIPRSAR